MTQYIYIYIFFLILQTHNTMFCSSKNLKILKHTSSWLRYLFKDSWNLDGEPEKGRSFHDFLEFLNHRFGVTKDHTSINESWVSGKSFTTSQPKWNLSEMDPQLPFHSRPTLFSSTSHDLETEGEAFTTIKYLKKNTHHRVESFWFMIPSDLQRMVAGIFVFVRFPPAKTRRSTCSLLECGVHHTSIVLNLNMAVEITWVTKAPTEGGSSESFVSSIFSRIFYTHISKHIFHLISHMCIYIYHIYMHFIGKHSMNCSYRYSISRVDIINI